MKRILGILVLVLAAFAVYWFVFKKDKSEVDSPKESPVAVMKHSEAFNAQIDKVIENYLGMKDAFVIADTATVKLKAVGFIDALDNIDMNELEKDTALIVEIVQATLRDLKANTESILNQNDLTEMRRDFSSLTAMMYPTFFTAVNYEGKKLYFQHCPMAFEGGVGANWISGESEVVNPYLGTNHPKYKGTMLHCGEVKDSIENKNTL